MKYKSFNSLIIATVAFVIACGQQVHSPTSADIVVPFASSVPFKAEFETAFTFLSPPPVLSLQITGNGKATHLGKTTWFSNSTVDGTVVPNIQTGSMAFTGASGDQLLGSFAGTATPPDANGNVTFTGNFEITGGTGRYDGASGSGTYSGGANIFVGSGQLKFVGRVSSVGSLRN